MHFFADYGSPLSYVHICRYQSFLIGINRESLGGEKKSSTRIRSIEKKKKTACATRSKSNLLSLQTCVGEFFFLRNTPSFPSSFADMHAERRRSWEGRKMHAKLQPPPSFICPPPLCSTPSTADYVCTGRRRKNERPEISRDQLQALAGHVRLT